MLLYDRKKEKIPEYKGLYEKTIGLFQDEKSIELFKMRHLWNVMDEENEKCFYVQSLNLVHSYEKKTFSELVDQIKLKDLVVYGCEETALACKSVLKEKELKFSFFYVDDKFRKTDTFDGIPYIERSQLQDNPEKYGFVIATTMKSQMNIMRDNLLQIGIPEKSIVTLEFDMGSQYFDLQELIIGQNEIFVDGGSFDGENSMIFSQVTSGHYKKIIAFEPDEKNVQQVMKVKDEIHDFNYIQGGLWSTTKDLYFSNMGTVGSSIVNQGTCSIKVFSLDDVVDEDGATFIKMDIEGAELEALKGCKNTILKHKPKLAISIYHKPEDIYEIPLYLKKLVPEYKYYIRHYGFGICETILYAIT